MSETSTEQRSRAAVRLPERIRTARLLLRPPSASDAADIVAGIGDLSVARMLTRVPHPYREADFRGWLAAAGAERAEGRGHALLIERDGAAIGGVAIDAIGLAADGSVEGNHFGYWLARSHWGKGYASEAVGALIAAAFREAGFARLRSSVFADNPASFRVQQKLGFSVTHRAYAHCLARGHEVEHIHTVLDRSRFGELKQ